MSVKKLKLNYTFSLPQHQLLYTFQNSSDMSVLERRLPNYKDFSRSILEQKYFLSDGYINPESSKLFTSKFCNYYFTKSQ
jgi:hypothetical protein